MAEMSYPPWGASSTLEKNSKPKKWNNIKRAFKKPWERKPQYKHPTKKREDHTRSPLSSRPGREESSFRELQFGQFAPFGPGRQKINPLSGGGNPFLFHQLTGGGGYPNYHSPTSFKPYSKDSPYEKKKSYEEDKLSKDMFSPPTPKSSRPALSNIFPMYDSPKVNKTPVNKTKSSPVKPTSPPKPQLSNQRRNSNPTVDAASQQMLERRPSHTYAQSTTSDITFERTGRRERRASAIRVLPTLPAADSQRSIPGQEKEESKLTNKVNTTNRTPSLTSSCGKDSADSSTTYSWSQQPHEQLQELEEEIEGEGPEGEEDNMGVMLCEREETHESVIEKIRRKNPKSSKLLTKISRKDDFTDEFVRQLTLGDDEEDVLY